MADFGPSTRNPIRYWATHFLSVCQAHPRAISHFALVVSVGQRFSGGPSSPDTSDRLVFEDFDSGLADSAFVDSSPTACFCEPDACSSSGALNLNSSPSAGVAGGLEFELSHNRAPGSRRTEFQYRLETAKYTRVHDMGQIDHSGGTQHEGA